MKGKLLLKLLGAVLVLLLVTLAGLYGVLRSSTLLKKYVLPFVSSKIGQPLTVDSIDIMPLRGLTIDGLRFNCEGTSASCASQNAFSLYIGSLKATYHFWELFTGRLSISSLQATTVWVSIADSAQSSSPSAPPASANDPDAQVSDSTSKKSGFAYSIADASIKNGTFIYTAAPSSGSYKLEDIAINVPRADSDGDGTITINTRATIKSQAVAFENQPLSLQAGLSRCLLFKPELLNLQVSAGLPATKPLELAGTLEFSSEPYALRKVSVTSATIREGLLQILTIPFEPVKEFEYSLRGHYALETPARARIEVTVNKNLFANGSGHDLKGTTLRSDLQIESERISLTDGAIVLNDAGTTLASSSISGSIAYDTYSKPSNITLRASHIDFDKIRALANDSKPQQQHESTAPANGQANSDPASRASQQAPASSSTIRLPLLTLDARIEKATVQQIEASPVTLVVNIPNNRTIEKATLNATFAQGGSLAMNAGGSLDSTLSFKALGKEVNMIPFAAAAADAKGQILEGGLKSLDVNITAQGKDIRRTLNGHATLMLSRMLVPSTLQEQVPFNILFLPLDALITIFGGAINLMLPASISSISDSIKQTLDDAGRLGLDPSTIDLRFEQGKILFKNVDINTKNLPDFTFKGSITADDRLDLTVFMALLKLNLPLPIAGTLQSPLPDVAYVGPELVRGLGLSIGNIAGSAASIFSSSKGGSEQAQELNKLKQ